MFDIQAALYASHSVVIPEGVYNVASPIQVPNDVAFGGALPGGVTINVITPGIAAFEAIRTTDAFSGIHVCNLTIETEQTEVTGVHTAMGGDNSFSNIKFRGLARNLHVDRGAMHSLENLRSYPSPSGVRSTGVILFESSTPTEYVQYISVDDIHSWETCYSSPLIFHRATNVTAKRLHIHEPGQTAILIDDDCQEVEISQAQLVKPLHGVVVQAANGSSPLGVSLQTIAVDQSLDGGFGIFLTAGKDIRVSDCYLTSNWQGVYLGRYTGDANGLERVTLHHNHLAENRNNGIFADAGAAHFRFYNNDITGHAAGSGIYLGGGANHFRVINNDLSEGNLFKLSDASGAVSDKTIGPNFL